MKLSLFRHAYSCKMESGRTCQVFNACEIYEKDGKEYTGLAMYRLETYIEEPDEYWLYSSIHAENSGMPEHCCTRFGSIREANKFIKDLNKTLENESNNRPD